MNKYVLYVWFGLVLSAGLFYYFSRNVYAPDTGLTHLVFRDANNTEFSLDHFSDQAVVVHFFASWCGPCMKELPQLNAQSNWLTEQGVKVIGLTDDNPSTISKMHAQFDLQFPVYQLNGSLRKNGVPSIPTTFVINKNGKLVLSQAGTINWSDENTLRELLQKLGTLN